MGEHHLDEAHGLVRVAGRGAVAATAALALTGAGGGLALATEGHEGEHGGEHGGHGWDDGHEYVASEDATCDTDPGGLLSDLGLSGSPDEFCVDDAWSEHPDSGHPDSGEHGAETQPAAEAQPAAAAAEPAQNLPAPGETRTIDLPDEPSGQA